MTSLPDLRSDIAALIGENGVRSGDGLERYLVDPRGTVIGKSRVVAMPQSVEDVQKILRYANAKGTPVVPQGGNTGMVRAAGSSNPDSIILSLEKMDRIELVDATGNTLTVGGGAILANVCEAASDADRLFPMHLGSFGSCQIGGLISTNAGGVSVLKYGMMRDLVLGIEAVLPDGRVINEMNRLRKNNVGYDLKQLFIGAEGTLGVVTSAVLKLFAKPRHYETAFLAVPSVEAALDLFHFLSAACAGLISAYEYISADVIRFAEKNLGLKCPLPGDHEHFVLLEVEVPGVLKETGLLGEELSRQEAEGLWLDAVIASNESQRQALWKLRESLPEAVWRTGRSISHDVSVPLGRLAEFMALASERLKDGFIVAPFGHIGDGNIHLTVIGGERDAAAVKKANGIVYEATLAMQGSISAEHGLGRDKIALAESNLPAESQRLRREIKNLLDPNRIMSPETLFSGS